MSLRSFLPTLRWMLLPAAFAASAAHAQTYGVTMPVTRLQAGMHIIQAEVAASPTDRSRGLMQRERLGPNQGMVFLFDEKAVHCMWMRNTLIPLSVAFLDDDGSILNIEDMQPQTETSHCAAKPARFALEMSKGWFKQRGLAAGARITGLPPVPAR